MPRDGSRWIASLASQLPQGLQATAHTLQERACLAMATAGSHRWQASSHRNYKQQRTLCRSELASRWQPLDRIAGKPAPTGTTSNTAHSVGASLPRDGNRWSASLASQFPQDYKQHRALRRSELASRWQPLERIAGKPAPTGSTSNTAHSVGASFQGSRAIERRPAAPARAG